MNAFITMLPTLMTIIGALAIVVSVIIEVIKNIGVLAKIPTDLVVIILSILVSIAVFFAYASIEELEVTWYWVVGVFVGGFFVAFVSMFGWTKLTEIVSKFKK